MASSQCTVAVRARARVGQVAGSISSSLYVAKNGSAGAFALPTTLLPTHCPTPLACPPLLANWRPPPLLFAQFADLGRLVLSTPVRVEDHARALPAARGDGHPQRGADERRAQVVGDGPADHAAREHVEHRRQIQPAF